MDRSFVSKVVSGSLLIAGTTIGAGMLGIPLVTSQCGFVPAIIITVIVWAFMLATGLLLLRATLWMPNHSSFLSISRHFLGRWGEVVTGVMFIFLYYCLMIAYFAAGSHLVAHLGESLFGASLIGFRSTSLLTLFFFIIVFIGPKSIDRVNIGLSVLMFIAWFSLIFMGAPSVKAVRFESANYSHVWLAFPLLFGAFGYHNIIPSITSYLGRNKKALMLSIVVGATIPLIIYIVWQWLIIGALSQEAIQNTVDKGLPVTFALQSITHTSKIFLAGQLFALLAIITSVLGVSFSLVDFLADGFKVRAKGFNRFWLCLLTFIPPMLFSITYPQIFREALSIAGGFGEAILNGLLPVALIYVGKYVMKLKQYETFKDGKLILLILALFSAFVFVVQLADTFSWI